MSDLDELEQQTKAMLAAAGPLVLENIKHVALAKSYVAGDPLATAFNEGQRSVFTELYELSSENQDAQLH